MPTPTLHPDLPVHSRPDQEAGVRYLAIRQEADELLRLAGPARMQLFRETQQAAYEKLATHHDEVLDAIRTPEQYSGWLAQLQEDCVVGLYCARILGTFDEEMLQVARRLIALQLPGFLEASIGRPARQGPQW